MIKFNLRQVMTFVGVFEAGSFSKAAKRLNATQSALSMQIQNLERSVGVPLFERSAKGVVPTSSARKFYDRVVSVLRDLDAAALEASGNAGNLTGQLRIGLMPTFTRGVFAPALKSFLAEFPNVEVSVVEAYSAVLTEGVAAGQFDFAIVPSALHRDGIRSRWIGRDREVLVRKAGAGRPHLESVRLKDFSPLRLVLPAPGNARRDAFETYASLNGIEIGALMNMDAMMATLDLVACSDWMTILPQTICLNDIDGKIRTLHPIDDPVLTVDYLLVEPARLSLPTVAEHFVSRLEDAFRRGQENWDRSIAKAVARTKPRAKGR